MSLLFDGSKFFFKYVITHSEYEFVAHHLYHGYKVQDFDGSHLRLLLALADTHLHPLTLSESPLNLSDRFFPLFVLLDLVGSGHYGLKLLWEGLIYRSHRQLVFHVATPVTLAMH